MIGIGLGSLVGGWLTYDLLCKSPLRHRSALLTAICFTGITAVAYGLVQVMGSRAAYIHVGAMIGTCMAANVFFVIIPGQRAMVDAMAEGEQPDASRGRDGALRSLHNNYFTLPVLFIMVSSHYPMTYGHRLNWAPLADCHARATGSTFGAGAQEPVAFRCRCLDGRTRLCLKTENLRFPSRRELGLLPRGVSDPPKAMCDLPRCPAYISWVSRSPRGGDLGNARTDQVTGRQDYAECSQYAIHAPRQLDQDYGGGAVDFGAVGSGRSEDTEGNQACQ